MRPVLLLAAAAAVSGCAASTPALEVQSSTPAGIQIAAWCPSADDGACRQKVADAAQDHCKKFGQNAQYVRSMPMENDLSRGSRIFFDYNCTP